MVSDMVSSTALPAPTLSPHAYNVMATVGIVADVLSLIGLGILLLSRILFREAGPDGEVMAADDASSASLWRETDVGAGTGSDALSSRSLVEVISPDQGEGCALARPMPDSMLDGGVGSGFSTPGTTATNTIPSLTSTLDDDSSVYDEDEPLLWSMDSSFNARHMVSLLPKRPTVVVVADRLVLMLCLVGFGRSLAMLAQETSFLLQPAEHIQETICFTQAIVTFTFDLSSFLWTLALSFHLYNTLVRDQVVKALSYERMYHAVAWGIPAIFLTYILATQRFSKRTASARSSWCFIKADDKVTLFTLFYGPFGLVLLVNFMLYFLIWRKLGRSDLQSIVTIQVESPDGRDASDPSSLGVMRRRIILCNGIFFLCWIWPFINRIQGINGRPIPLLFNLQSAGMSLWGFFIGIAYGFRGHLTQQWKALFVSTGRKMVRGWRIVLAFVVVVLIRGSIYLFIDFGDREFPPMAMNFTRCFIAAFILGGIHMASPKLRAGAWRLFGNARLHVTMAIIGASFSGVATTMVMYSERSLAPGVAAVIASATPVFAYAGSILLGEDRFTAIGAVGLLLGLVGEVLILLQRILDNSPVINYFVILLAAVIYASATVAAKRLLKGVHPLNIAWGQALYGGLVAFLGAWAWEWNHSLGDLPNHFGFFAEATWKGWLPVLYLAVMTSIVSNFLYYWLIENAGSMEAASVFFVVPGVGVLEGILFAQEWRGVDTVFKFCEVSGLIFVIIGLVLVTARRGFVVARGAQARHSMNPTYNPAVVSSASIPSPHKGGSMVFDFFDSQSYLPPPDPRRATTTLPPTDA